MAEYCPNCLRVQDERSIDYQNETCRFCSNDKEDTICSNCKSENIDSWNGDDYVCLDCRYSSLYEEIMTQEDFDNYIKGEN